MTNEQRRELQNKIMNYAFGTAEGIVDIYDDRIDKGNEVITGLLEYSNAALEKIAEFINTHENLDAPFPNDDHNSTVHIIEVESRTNWLIQSIFTTINEPVDFEKYL